MRRIGALIFPGFELLDIFGPLEMFGILRDEFDIKLVAESGEPVTSSQQARANPDLTTKDDAHFDILFVPGGFGTRREVNNAPLLEWVAAKAEQAEYVVSVCTGSIILAAAGVLDGRRATTNKAAFARLTPDYPKVDWVPKARWVEDGKFITSSGVSAGMDMALGFIAMLHGHETAKKVAFWTEYEWHQDKDWDPFAKAHGLE